MAVVTTEALEAGLETVRGSPKDHGSVVLIVCRPAENERRTLEVGVLDPVEGLVGDSWLERGSGRTRVETVNPDRQVTVMNARVATLVAGGPDHGGLPGDQLYVDLDLSQENLRTGDRLQVGSAVLQVTEEPHLGCHKFSARFGPEALRFVNSLLGQSLRLRGVNTRVVRPGTVEVGDRVDKVPADG